MAEETPTPSATDNKTGESATPTPSATDNKTGASATPKTNADQPAVDSTANTTSTDEIKDPGAYFKAQYEATERLRKKAAEELETLKKRSETIESDVIKELQTKYETTSGELEKLRSELADKTTETMRLRAIAEAGLDASFARRLQGDTVEALIADAKQLAEMFPTPGGNGKQKGEGAKTGHTAGGSTLTLEAIKAMSTQEYLDRKPEIDEFMRNQK